MLEQGGEGEQRGTAVFFAALGQEEREGGGIGLLAPENVGRVYEQLFLGK